MAISVTADSYVSIPTATTTNYSFDIGSDNDIVILSVAQSSRYAHVTSVTYGGKSLVKRIEASYSVGGHQRGEIWSYEGSDIPSGSNTMSVVTNAATDRIVLAYGMSGQALYRYNTWSKSSSAGNVQFSMAGGSENGVGFVAGSHRTTASGPISGTTADGTLAAGSDLEIGHETAVGTGTRSVGFSGTWLVAAVGIMYNEFVVESAPDPISVEIEMPAPTVTGVQNIVDHPYPITVDVFMPVPTVTAPVPRQLPLVGVNVDMPGRVEVAAGLTTPMLSQVLGVPTWVEAPTWVADHGALTGLADDDHTQYALRPAGSTTSAADSLAIPITDGIVYKTTGVDAEALTLADGSDGQELTIVLVSDGGGDGTLTPTTSTDFGTVVFADAGDRVTLRYVDDTVGWVITGASGLTAQPTVTLA